jgi:hypothetical protein
MNRLLDNRLRKLEAQRSRDPFAGLSDDELDTRCGLVRGAAVPRDGHLLAPLDAIKQGRQVDLGLERSDLVHQWLLNWLEL